MTAQKRKPIKTQSDLLDRVLDLLDLGLTVKARELLMEHALPLLLAERQAVQSRIKPIYSSDDMASDDADKAAEASEAHNQAALKANDENCLLVLQEAIQRFETGAFGICVVCDAQIPTDRMACNLLAKHCIEHAS